MVEEILASVLVVGLGTGLWFVRRPKRTPQAPPIAPRPVAGRGRIGVQPKVTIEAKVTRKDGTQEDLGVIHSSSDK